MKVPAAAIMTTKIVAFRVIPPAVSGNIVIGSIGALDARNA
jgi:hypothetical protein